MKQIKISGLKNNEGVLKINIVQLLKKLKE